jgi:hypothetical protein
MKRKRTDNADHKPKKAKLEHICPISKENILDENLIVIRSCRQRIPYDIRFLMQHLLTDCKRRDPTTRKSYLPRQLRRIEMLARDRGIYVPPELIQQAIFEMKATFATNLTRANYEQKSEELHLLEETVERHEHSLLDLGKIWKSQRKIKTEIRKELNVCEAENAAMMAVLWDDDDESESD